jgi:hypothetical protein
MTTFARRLQALQECIIALESKRDGRSRSGVADNGKIDKLSAKLNDLSGRVEVLEKADVSQNLSDPPPPGAPQSQSTTLHSAGLTRSPLVIRLNRVAIVIQLLPLTSYLELQCSSLTVF